MELSENAFTLLKRIIGVSLNVTTKTNLYNIESGKNFSPIIVIMNNFSGNASAGVANLGCNANADDWLAAIAMTNATDTAPEDGIILSKIGLKTGAMTAEKVKRYPGPLDFGIKMNAAIAFTCDIEVWGLRS